MAQHPTEQEVKDLARRATSEGEKGNEASRKYVNNLHRRKQKKKGRKVMKRHENMLTICIGENKGADQLRSNCEADQRLCFRYSDSTIPLESHGTTSYRTRGQGPGEAGNVRRGERYPRHYENMFKVIYRFLRAVQIQEFQFEKLYFF